MKLEFGKLSLRKDTVSVFVKKYGTLVGFLVLSIYFGTMTPRFLTMSNFVNVLTQISMLAICAFGMSHVILTGNIDLSVGNVVSLVGIVVAAVMASTGNTVIGVLAGLATGIAFGCYNGLLVAYVGVPAFICTLANSSVAVGLTYMVCAGQPIYKGITEKFMFLGQGYFLGIPVPVIILLLVFLCAQIFLTRTRRGRHLFAVGGNPEASRLSGINNKSVVLSAFAISGLMAAISGFVLTARLGTGQPTGGSTYSLDAIASSYLGTTAFKEGQINMPGTFLGALIIGVLNNGLTLLNVPYFYQNVFKGLLIIAAVALNAYYRGKEGEVSM